MIWRVLIISLTMFHLAAHARDCQLSGTVCVDASPSKTISGVAVSLATVGGCWEYQDTYTCIKTNAVDYCQPFAGAQPQCWQTNSQCVQTDTTFNTGCMKSTQTWRCGDSSTPTASNTIRLDDTFTLVSSDYDPGPCQSLAGNSNCQIAETRCTSTTPPALPPGISVSLVAPDGCYQKQTTYACLTGRTDTSECDGYASNPACTLQSSACDGGDYLGGQCVMESRSYQCVSRPAETRQITDCSGQLFCQDGKCFDKSYPKDTDFGRAISLMEASREAGVYMDPNSIQIFSGTDSRCRIKLFGLANCCKKSDGGAGYSNSALFSVAMQSGGQALKYGSAYVYDALYTSDAPNWMVEGLAAMIGIDPINFTSAVDAFSPTLSLYGFTVTTGTLSTGISSLGSFSGLQFGFDPTSFAISMGLMILQELLSCDQQEQILAMRRGQRLCVEVGSYCSQELNLLITDVCLEKKKSYCCFNSRLARIINEQGRGQIGKSWGSGKSPNCMGFTMDEFERIDFSRVDLSEFVQEITASVRMPDVSSFGQNVQTSVQQRVNSYYNR